MDTLLKFTAFLCLLLLSACSGKPMEKVNGISFVASREEVAQEHVAEVLKIHANHAAIMPFGFIRNSGSPEIIFDTDRQWYGETSAGAKQYIDLLHRNGIKTMLKPQLWIWRGEFTGAMTMASEKDWKTLEASYRDFILTYAKVAETMHCDLFCIGTELEKFVAHRPDYWKEIVSEIRQVYSGKLTYAANWDEFPRVPFWRELDYIGIDAYFPLSEAKSPSREDLREGWKKWKRPIQRLADSVERPVLFTEYGYRSVDFTAKKPWVADRHEEGVNLDAQDNATRALMEEFWPESWFAGGFVWKWFIRHKEVGGESDNRFTPQNKPAQKVLQEYYSKYD